MLFSLNLLNLYEPNIAGDGQVQKLVLLNLVIYSSFKAHLVLHDIV